MMGIDFFLIHIWKVYIYVLKLALSILLYLYIYIYIFFLKKCCLEGASLFNPKACRQSNTSR